MRPIAISVLLILALLTFVTASWDKDDYEIFELQAALEKDEGEGSNFYSFLNLTKAATAADIRKAYRSRSMELHPDKYIGNQENAQRRFERLGVINKILRDHRKDRYDYFLTNGFPKWRGSGYFYARYRPGLGAVLVFLALITACIELAIKSVNYNRDTKRLQVLTSTAKVLAWGPRFRSIEADIKASSTGDEATDRLNKGFIVPPEKKVRVPLSGIDVPAAVPRKANEDAKQYWDNDEKAIRKAIASGTSAGTLDASSRRYIDAIVTREAEVLIQDPTSKEWTVLDDGSTVKPAFIETWPFALFHLLISKVAGQTQQPSLGQEGNDDEEPTSTNGIPDTTSAPLTSSKKRSKGNKKNK